MRSVVEAFVLLFMDSTAYVTTRLMPGSYNDDKGNDEPNDQKP
jgi:hypothetical protein